MVHVADAQMPADCLTKWIPSGKVRQSVQYMTNPAGRAASTLGTRPACDLAELDEAIANLASHDLSRGPYRHGNELIAESDARWGECTALCR